MDALTAALKVAASGLGAQSERLRVVSENLANAQSTGNTAGADPYQRKTITFESEFDRLLGATTVDIKSIGADSRKEIGEILGQPVHLFLFVKVRENWGDDPNRYREMGLEFPKE